MALLRRGGELLNRGGALLSRAVVVPPPAYFEMIVKTDNTGSSAINQFTIPTTGGGYNYTVETSEQLLTGQTGNVTLEWAVAGTYYVRITGDFPRVYFDNGLDKSKLLEVSNWGDNVWASMSNAFYGCGNFNITALDSPDLSNVTNMDAMFIEAVSFNADISSWNVSSVKSMDAMFFGASAFNSNINNWNVSSVTSMDSMFREASAFNSNINNWDVSNVENMSNMFREALGFNSNISNWNVGSVTGMVGMFLNASAFNQDLSSWCVEQIPSTPTAFDIGATSWVLPRPNWGDPC